MIDLEKRNKYKPTSPNLLTVTFALATAPTFHLDPCNAGGKYTTTIFNSHWGSAHTIKLDSKTVLKETTYPLQQMRNVLYC